MTKPYRLTPMANMPEEFKRRGREAHSERDCYFCGREIKKAMRYWIHSVRGGAQIVHPEDSARLSDDPAEMPGDCGLHEIGSTCRKYAPKDFIIEWDGKTEARLASDLRESAKLFGRRTQTVTLKRNSNPSRAGDKAPLR